MDKQTRPDSGNIDFKLLNEGLGFQKQAGTMPYAPTNPKKITKRMTGTGATQAGTPLFVNPPPRVSRPVQSRIPETAPVPTPMIENKKEALPTYSLVFKRITSVLIDLTVSSVVTVGTFSISAHFLSIPMSLFLNPGVQLLVGGSFLLFHWSLVLLEELIFQTSLGKWALGLYLSGSRIGILFRGIFFLASAFLLGIGLIWSLFDKKKRCIHDILSDVEVKEKLNAPLN